MSAESKLGALRGAKRDGVLGEVLKQLKLFSASDLFDNLIGANHETKREIA